MILLVLDVSGRCQLNYSAYILVAVHAERLNLLHGFDIVFLLSGAILRGIKVGNLASDGLEELGRVLLGGTLLVRRHFVYFANKRQTLETVGYWCMSDVAKLLWRGSKFFLEG